MSHATQELLSILTSNHGVSSPTAAASSSSSSSSYHTALQTLRDEGDSSFLFLRTIIELTSLSTSSSSSTSDMNMNVQHKEELLFHSILGFRHVMLFRWTTFSFDFKSVCRDYLFALGLDIRKQQQQSMQSQSMQSQQQPMLSKPLSNVCLAAAASFWKRSWNSNTNNANTNTNTNSASGSQSQSPPLSSEEQHLIQMMTSHPNVQIHSIPSIFNLYTLLESIIVLQPFDESATQTQTSTTSSTQTQYMAKRACVFLSNLIGEFSGSNSATQYNCSLEFHHAVHVMFEHNVGLVDALKIAMGALGGIVSKLLTTTTTTTTNQR
mmetsp:Transcript_23932/g.27313  ORF Transcript_23932/g.27313 Transcript_23932/m.27313 type:complete len:323 (-) Transcript_23932:869-1837(-)